MKTILMASIILFASCEPTIYSSVEGREPIPNRTRGIDEICLGGYVYYQKYRGQSDILAPKIKDQKFEVCR